MQINFPTQNTQHLSYCSNIHPGETWEKTFQNLKDNLPGVRASISPQADFGIGLRLSAQAASDLSQPENLAEFKEFLKNNPFYLFTVNGFPYGQFHGTTVKENVYLPNWLDTERVRYTNQLADLLAELLPEGVAGSISTVPGAFKPSVTGENEVQSMAENMVRQAAHLVELKNRTGKMICLALEPEPCCFLETIEETCDFFTNHLYSETSQKLLCELTGASINDANTLLREHLTVCLDICHAAVEYENAQACIAQLTSNNCKVGKLQISAGLMFDTVNAETVELLKPFEDKVYLHQVVGREANKLSRFPDLSDAFASLASGETFDEWRVHFHVPVFLGDFGKYKSTQAFTKEILQIHKASPISEHLEIETYTWGVLPDEVKTENMQDAIIRELHWVQSQLN